MDAMTDQVTPVVAVAGTWAANGERQWWREGSAWWRFMRRRGLDAAHLVCTGLVGPFEWQTNLGTSWQFWRQWWPGKKGVAHWEYYGWSLVYYLDQLPLEDRNLVAHSHGGQVVLYAATRIPINRLVTIGTPRRHDMAAVTDQAAPNIGEWIHVLDRDRDWTAMWGGVGDGHVGVNRQQPAPAQNVLIPDVGHSDLLSDPDDFHIWDREHMTDFLRGGRDAAA